MFMSKIQVYENDEKKMSQKIFPHSASTFSSTYSLEEMTKQQDLVIWNEKKCKDFCIGFEIV